MLTEYLLYKDQKHTLDEYINGMLESLIKIIREQRIFLRAGAFHLSLINNLHCFFVNYQIKNNINV